MARQIVTGTAETKEDRVLMSEGIRPQRLEDYIGQEKIKDSLRVYMEAARMRGDALDHVLFYGPPGLGKTTLAGIIANEMGTSLKVTSGPAIEKPGEIAAILNNLQEGDILFVDEIHRLNRQVEEVLYPAMEDYAIDMGIGKGATARSIRLELPKFTLVGATTRPGMLTAPLRDRFGVVGHLDYYSVPELKLIIERTAERLRGLGIDRISDIPEHSKEIREAMGKHGDFLIGLAQGIDDREVTPYRPENAKSVSREMTFQADITDYGFLHDVLLLMALSVEERASKYGLKGNGVQIKVTYTDMKTVTRVRSNNGGSDALSLAKGAWTLLDDLEKKPVRLIGIGMTDIGNKKLRQTTLDEKEEDPLPPGEELSYFLERMHRRYRFDFVKNREWMLRIDRLHGVVEHMRIQKIKAAKKHRTDQSVPRHSWKRTNQDSVHGKVQE